jgi:hypothetical protein
MDIFEKEDRLNKYFINHMDDKKGGEDFIRSIFKLELLDLDSSEQNDLLRLYNIVGFDNFFEIVSQFSTQTIKIPRAEKIRKLIIIAVAYYYVRVLGLSAKDAGKLLSSKLGVYNLKQKSINNIIKELEYSIKDIVEDYVENVEGDKDE